MTKSNPHAPASGWLDGETYVFPLRVYYEDTDFSGVVYHASYLRFLERGRSEFVRSIGAGHEALLKLPEPLTWALRRIAVDFHRPARIEEALDVRTRLGALTGARVRLDQEIVRGGVSLVTAKVEVCLIAFDGRARRIPDAVKTKMQTFTPE